MPNPKVRPVKFTLYLDVETHKALRIRAIEEGVTATGLVERLVKAYLARKGGEK